MNEVEEKSILNRFKSNFSAFPEGEIEQSDQPDFIVNGSRKIGIEITQIFQDQENLEGSILRKTETYQRLLLEDIIEVLRERKSRICLLDISLNHLNITPSLKPKILAINCANEICRNIPEDADFSNYTLTIQNEGQLPDFIYDLTMWFSSSLTDFEYVESSGGVGMTLTNKKLQFVLNKKEKLLKTYKECDEYWLIIKEGSSLADYFPAIDVDKSQIQTSFDQVFLIRQSGPEIIKLN
jgi:hypothetical protein